MNIVDGTPLFKLNVANSAVMERILCRVALICALLGAVEPLGSGEPSGFVGFDDISGSGVGPSAASDVGSSGGSGGGSGAESGVGPSAASDVGSGAGPSAVSDVGSGTGSGGMRITSYTI